MNWLVNLGLVLLLVVFTAAWVMLPWPGALAALVLLAAWLAFTRRGAQARSVVAVGLSTLRQRLPASAVIVVGIAGVVGVLVALLSMAEGYAETLRRSGSADTAVVMRGASASEVMSVLDRASVALIGQAPGVARDASGQPLASEEIVVAANLPVAGGGADDEGSVQLRGVGALAWPLRPQVRIVEGRRFTPGLRELIVGKGAARQFAGLVPGEIRPRRTSGAWTVVGTFTSGDAMESEIWADVNVVADTYRRGSGRNAVHVRLADPAAFAGFKSALESNPQLKVDAATTLDYYAKQSEGMTRVLRVIGLTVGAIMAIGAAFGALNTMFAAVAARAREIATLRAIGFTGAPVVVAMLETMLLALAGGAIGALVAYIIFNGLDASTMASGSVGKLSFSLQVTPALVWTGLKWALAIGFIGGLFPAMRAARAPVATALREL
ncbi:MAG: FtsX-like permease family protein [Rubrivivax sp.]